MSSPDWLPVSLYRHFVPLDDREEVDLLIVEGLKDSGVTSVGDREDNGLCTMFVDGIVRGAPSSKENCVRVGSSVETLSSPVLRNIEVASHGTTKDFMKSLNLILRLKPSHPNPISALRRKDCS